MARGSWLAERLDRVSERARERELEVRHEQSQEGRPWGSSEWWLYDFFGMDGESARYTLWVLAALLIVLLVALMVAALI